jgi:hypothetical protein
MNEKVGELALTPATSFKVYLFSYRYFKTISLIIVAIIITQFVVFKYFYPFASYIHGDSFVYLDIAYRNSNIDSYMVGYGRFLRLFSVFSSSDTVLVAFQYLLLQGSTLFFLMTLFYFYRPSRVVCIVLLCFMVLNPLFLYMGNLISSDGFFLALSFTWFTLLLWILHRPSVGIVIAYTLVIFIAFTVRYNALIYPFISAIVFLFSKQPILRKIAGMGIGIILCGLFVLYTGNQYKKLTGIWQYSPFSGWLMANNAMYAYRYVDNTQRKPVPIKFRELDNMIRAYFDSSRDLKKHPDEALQASTIYMWTYSMPLHRYKFDKFKNDTTASEIKRWASMGRFYKAYGSYIIKQYPVKYARYFLWPNFLKYYAPPVEFLEFYNSNHDYVLPIAQQWFGYKSNKVFPRTRNFHVGMLDFYPIAAGVCNVVMLCGLVCFFLLRGFKTDTIFRRGVILAGAIWLLNAGFTILASSAALRFQSFPILLAITFALLLMDWVWRTGAMEEWKKTAVPEIKGDHFPIVDVVPIEIR